MNRPVTVSGKPVGERISDRYRPAFDVYDEMLSEPGRTRPHWVSFAAAMDALSPNEITRHIEETQRLVEENGVTYNVVGEPADRMRPWELDIVPLLLDGAEWQRVSEGLAQRARLYNLILADLFGPQKLIRQRALPAEVLFGHPLYLPALNGLRTPDETQLHLYAADLARSPDGTWWIVGDRTGTPNGSGYALENRIVTSRVIPGIYRDCRVERLASYFAALRETLHQLAPRFQENPRIVLLSPGPGNPHYFEDAYLSRYLGYTLVESGDLAVRDNRVMLKTLGGLLPVEVILRRISDRDCDPVELGGDPKLGVPGLLEVLRAGNVAVANPPGSGLVESPLFLAFLPGLCRHLLGEELRISSVATWWCGQPDALQYVLDHFEELLIRPAFRTRETEPIRTANLSRDARRELMSAVRSRPEQYVGQETVLRSTAPVWAGYGLQPWHVALRTYLVAKGDSYTTMPGALVRVAETSPRLDHSMSAGDRSQDAWVTADGPVGSLTLLHHQREGLVLRRGGAELPSRVADNLFWLGRHAERAECAVRLLRSVFLRLTSEYDAAALTELPVLIRTLAATGQIEPGFAVEGVKEPLPDVGEVLPEAVLNPQEPRSLRATVDEMLRLAGVVRDRISTDSYRVISRIDQQCVWPPSAARVTARFTPDRSLDADNYPREDSPFARSAGQPTAAWMLSLLSRLVIDLSAFSGLVGESMTRGLGWRFLDIGRRLERAHHTATLLQSTLVQPAENESPVLEAVLEVGDSLMTYRSRYLANLQPAPVLDALLTDETNPRSVVYQLARLFDHVQTLPRDQSHAVRGPDERIAMSLLNTARLADIDALAAVKGRKNRDGLERLLVRLIEQLPKLAEAISHRYLIHSGVARQFASLRSDDQP